MEITAYERLNPNYVWAAYNTAFGPVRRRAMQKHVMSWEEWCEVSEDSRVQKHVAVEDGRVLGMSVITNKLDAWHWIEPLYFEANYPKQYEAEAVWYVGFVFTAQQGEARQVHTFSEVIRSMWPQVMESEGLAVMDYSKWAVEVNDIAKIAWHVQKRLNPHCVMVHADSQLYYVYDHAPGR